MGMFGDSIREVQVEEVKLDRDGLFNPLIRLVNRINAMMFNPLHFKVQGGFISLLPPIPPVPEDWGVKSIGAPTGGTKTVTLYGGTILVGTLPVTVADSTVSLASGLNLVGYELTYSSNALAILNFGVAITHDEQHIRVAKWEIFVDSSNNNAVSVRRKRNMDGYPANFGG